MFSIARLALAVAIGSAGLPAFAATPTLTIYTYDGFAAEWGPGPGLEAGFEKTCGCDLRFVATDSSLGALRRVQLEGTSTSADMVLGLDTSIAGEARATELFAPHGLDFSDLNLPVTWGDPEFAPLDFGYFAFVYGRRKVPNPPDSFEALIALPASFKIALQDPRSDTPGLGLLLWIKAAYGDRAPDIWKGLKPHIVTLARSWSDAYGLFLKGEADMVLSYTTSPAYHALAENDPNFAAATFKQGFYPQIEVAGILKSSPNQVLAQDFLRYLTSVDAQKIIPQTNWMYPVADIGADLPAEFGTPPTHVLGLSEADITANKAAWIEQALAAIR